jgi:hypothetical protein
MTPTISQVGLEQHNTIVTQAGHIPVIDLGSARGSSRWARHAARVTGEASRLVTAASPPADVPGTPASEGILRPCSQCGPSGAPQAAACSSTRRGSEPAQARSR